MVLRFLLFFLAFGPLAMPIQAGWFDNVTSYFRKPAPTPPPTIKVLVVHDKVGVVLEVKGKYKIYDPNNGEHISTRFIGKRKFIQAVRDGLKWGEEFPGVHQLLIIPDERGTTTIVDGIEYRGPVYVYDIGGTISIVNQVYIEDYLASILTQNFRDPLPNELLNAIAISARTAAYYNAANPKSQYWAVDGRQVGYMGFAAVDEFNPILSAIKDTRYMVMSTAAPKEEQIRAFPSEWKGRKGSGQEVFSQISLGQAEEMAIRGEHAAQILNKAYPGVKIELIHYAPEKVQPGPK